MENFFDKYYWVYVLQSLKDGKKYTGYTKNLPSRFEALKDGEVLPNKRQSNLFNFNGWLKQQDSTKLEKYSFCEIKPQI
jgi:putative endonuclease